MSTSELWFDRLTPDMQRQLVRDPAQRLTGELRDAVETARRVVPPGDRLSREDARWLEMESFADRHDELDTRWVDASIAGLKESDPLAYEAIRREVYASQNQLDALFKDQAAEIAQRRTRERQMEYQGIDPYDLRTD
jgi:hypothetical protein